MNLDGRVRPHCIAAVDVDVDVEEGRLAIVQNEGRKRIVVIDLEMDSHGLVVAVHTPVHYLHFRYRCHALYPYLQMKNVDAR
jgi:hypothetical protein